MSLRILTNIIRAFKIGLDVVNDDDIIIKKIEIEDDCVYTIEIKFHDKMYSIRHFEHIKEINGVNYGHGPWYDCDTFDEQKGHYVRIFYGPTILDKCEDFEMKSN